MKLHEGPNHAEVDLFHRGNLRPRSVLYSARCAREQDQHKCEAQLEHEQDAMIQVIFREIKQLDLF